MGVPDVSELTDVADLQMAGASQEPDGHCPCGDVRR